MKSLLLIKRRELIILATIDVIHECGVQDVSTKEIAKKQGISERIIYNHFPTKNDLFIAVLEHFTKYDDAIIQTTEGKRMNPIEAITYFFDSYATYYENYPALTSISQSYEALNHNPQLSQITKNILFKKENFIRKQIDEAINLNLLSASIDSEGLADIMLGTFSRLCLKWRLQEYNFSLRKKTIKTLEMILESSNK